MAHSRRGSSSLRRLLFRLVFSLGLVVRATTTCFRSSLTIPMVDTPTGLVCDCRSRQSTTVTMSRKNSHSSFNDGFAYIYIFFLHQLSIVGLNITFCPPCNC